MVEYARVIQWFRSAGNSGAFKDLIHSRSGDSINLIKSAYVSLTSILGQYKIFSF